MSEDPAEYGLSAADLHDTAARLYPPTDPRFEPLDWTFAEQARYGQIRSRLRAMADALEGRQAPVGNVCPRTGS